MPQGVSIFLTQAGVKSRQDRHITESKTNPLKGGRAAAPSQSMPRTVQACHRCAPAPCRTPDLRLGPSPSTLSRMSRKGPPHRRMGSRASPSTRAPALRAVSGRRGIALTPHREVGALQFGRSWARRALLLRRSPRALCCRALRVPPSKPETPSCPPPWCAARPAHAGSGNGW